jgi:hypothetical protein
LSAQGPAALIRPVVAGVLLASALALLKVSTPVIIAGAVVGFVVLVLLAPRRRAAEPTTPTTPELDPVH